MKTQSIPGRSRGFALVVTLSLMILLTVIAVGLLSLSSVSLRASSQTSDMSTARCNARLALMLALMLALGELQKQAGTDTRITARADILKADDPPVLGVWKSWEGDDHEKTGAAQGRPKSPGNYPTEKKAKFLSWLVSGDPAELRDSTNVPVVAKGAGKASLVGDRTVGSGADREKLQVHLEPMRVNSNTQQGAHPEC